CFRMPTLRATAPRPWQRVSADTVRHASLDKAHSAGYLGGAAAGWSSQVAREAHNLEVGGSNPPPAMSEPRPGRALDGSGGSGRSRPGPARLILLADDGAQPAIVGEVVPRPVHQHDQAIAEPDQHDQVDDEPGPPGEADRKSV